MKPCKHQDRPELEGADYVVEECRICWLYHNFPKYKAIWDNTPNTNDTESIHPKDSKPCNCGNIKGQLPTVTDMRNKLNQGKL